MSPVKERDRRPAVAGEVKDVRAKQVQARGEYVRSEAPSGSGKYRLVLPQRRLKLRVLRTTHGYIAEAPDLNVLGHGDNPVEAIRDLIDAVRDYLSIVKDDKLAPEVEHHAGYVGLLNEPEGSWFSPVEFDRAADVE